MRCFDFPAVGKDPISSLHLLPPIRFQLFLASTRRAPSAPESPASSAGIPAPKAGLAAEPSLSSPRYDTLSSFAPLRPSANL